MINPVKKLLADPKLLRYGAVSVFNLASHQFFLALGQQILDLEPTKANLLAATITAIPAFFLSRNWVWRAQITQGSMRNEAVLFWVIALLGLIISTIVVFVVSRTVESWLAIQAASLFGYFLVWIGKFFVLDRLFSKT